MRFLIIRKADPKTEAAVLPTSEKPSTMGLHNAELEKARAAVMTEGLKPSASGVRVLFSGGKTKVVEGPFTGTNQLVAGFTLIDAASKEEAVELVKRWPGIDSSDHDVEIEIRETGCPGGVEGVAPEEPEVARPALPEGHRRYVAILKTTNHTETGYVADDSVLSRMSQTNGDSIKAGVMLAGEGLKPSARGARVKFSKGRTLVTDGPFAEAKELVAGFWMVRMPSIQAAVEWVKAYPFPLGPDNEGEVEVRELYEASDTGALPG
ncbi:MAG: hypothetical protein HOW73_05370 [Polyangiaceae bacterium]|nr:hypothetical protein [Polyangiaceae bacterium]